jgi:hypothetical protein
MKGLYFMMESINSRTTELSRLGLMVSICQITTTIGSKRVVLHYISIVKFVLHPKREILHKTK